MENMTWEQILNRAIAKEQEACSNYTALAGWMRNPGTRQMLTELAEEEQKHKDLLENWREGHIKGTPPSSLPDLGVIGNRHDFKFDRDLNPEEAVRFAIREEERAFAFYDDLAKALEEEGAKSLAERLAAEERRHKFKLESLLGDEIFREM